MPVAPVGVGAAVPLGWPVGAVLGPGVALATPDGEAPGVAVGDVAEGAGDAVPVRSGRRATYQGAAVAQPLAARASACPR